MTYSTVKETMKPSGSEQQDQVLKHLGEFCRGTR